MLLYEINLREIYMNVFIVVWHLLVVSLQPSTGKAKGGSEGKATDRSVNRNTSEMLQSY